jgi:hypothetical protein
VEPCGAGGDTYGQRVRRDRSRSSGSAGRFAECDSDSGQCVPICQRVQARGGARHLVSAPTCRAIACPDFRTLDRVRRRSGSPVVVAATWATAPRLSGSRRARNRRSADDDCLAETRLLEPAGSARCRSRLAVCAASGDSTATGSAGFRIPPGGRAPVLTFPCEGRAELTHHFMHREWLAAPFTHGAAQADLAAACLVDMGDGNLFVGFLAPCLAPCP